MSYATNTRTSTCSAEVVNLGVAVPPLFSMATLFIVAIAALNPPLVERKYTPLPVGSITPTGWLLTQLQLQADGLSGHLAQFWPDVQKSVWIGGGGDGGLHERTPYWLNGIVPLAFLLRNANATLTTHHAGIWKAPSPNSEVIRNASLTRDAEVNCGAHLSAVVVPLVEGGAEEEDDDDDGHFHMPDGPAARRAAALPTTAVDLISQVKCYIEYILSHQATDGWLGPRDVNNTNAPWGRSNIILALAQYAEAVPDSYERVTRAMLAYLLALKKRIVKLPIGGWAQQRWQEMALGAQWMLDHAPQGHEADLLDLLHTLHTQGSDWEAWFDGNFKDGIRGANGHNVNNAQALKSAAVAYRQSGNASLANLSASRVQHLDKHCGLPTGM